MSTPAPKYLTAPDPNESGWPKGVPYIVGNEACERFSFYGMKAILQVHMTLLFTASILLQSHQGGVADAEALRQARAILNDQTGVGSEGQTAEYTLDVEKLGLTDRLSDEQKTKWRNGELSQKEIATVLQKKAGDLAQEKVHLFNAGVYALPMIGAIIADRLLGKYLTIISLSLVYCLGHLVLAVAENTLGGMYLGLGLIAVGSGGIKPCVSAHVGDQFGRGNWRLVEKVFQIFYFSVNLGSFLATLSIPWLNSTYGPGVAFGVPGVLMFLATIAFWMGRHVFIHVPPSPGGRLGLLDTVSSALLFLAFIGIPMFGNDLMPRWMLLCSMGGCAVLGFVLFKVREKIEQDHGFLAVFVYSVASLMNGKNVESRRAAQNDGAPEDSLRRHWFFAAASDRFGEDIAEGPRAVLRIISVFLLVSVFWALFDQHSSTWIRQAGQMDRSVDLYFVKLDLLQSQIQSLNPLFVMLLIPFSNFVVYPGFERLGFRMTPLRRMSIGMFTASLAFVAVALIQHRVDSSAENTVTVLWQIIPFLIITQAEVMVSITGLEFAYTQAPRPMKSTIMGFWLLSVSLGNVLVALLTRFQNMPLVQFFWVFAGLMGAAGLLFSLFAAMYQGKTYIQEADDGDS